MKKLALLSISIVFVGSLFAGGMGDGHLIKTDPLGYINAKYGEQHDVRTYGKIMIHKGGLLMCSMDKKDNMILSPAEKALMDISMKYGEQHDSRGY